MKKFIWVCFILFASMAQSENFQKGFKAYKQQDYKTAYKEWLPLAEQGDSSAQYNLGLMYSNGKGVKQDYTQAVAWYRKAAEQGDSSAQSNLGWMYSNGKGVKQDYTQAVAWYRKAAEQGDSSAQSNLGLMYENGQGVKKDLQKALLLYKKSGSNWAMNRHRSLNKRLNCLSLAKTKIFSVPLICASRDDFMFAIKNTKAQVKREDKGKWGDIYLTSNVLKGSSELAVYYTFDDFFAKATYTFPSSMDSKQIVGIRNFVANKYGDPNYKYGSISVGKVTYKWYLEDGIELTVLRDWPNTTTYLSYTYPENYLAMTKEQDRQKKEREEKEYQKQDNAF